MKRIFDVIISTLALVVLAIPILCLAALVRWKLGSPVLFCQTRPGKGGKLFTMYKFRTMTDARDREGSSLPDADRLTPFGMWLRASSLDELPELWNVWKGDMSIVGPRPLLPEYLPLYSKEQARRHEVRPGITGLAQVRGRNNLSWEEKFKYDIEYVKSRNFFLDLKIIMLTFRKVLRKEGIQSQGSPTAEKFRGRNHT